MLKAIDLHKKYKPKDGQIVNALDGVSVDFADTGMVFILGKSGSGKSTLLNVLGGLDKYDSGEVIVKGKSSKDFSQADFDSYRNTFIGFIFQEYNILQEFSVEKNIGLALELQGKKADKEAINALIEQVDLSGYGKRKPNTLSGGQKQRVAIARALVKNPEIIMADEPTGALDSKTGAQVLDTLKKLSKEKLVIVVSHDREFAEYYGDRIIELSDGKIISDQFKHEIKPRENDGIEIVDDKVLTIKKGTKLTEYNLDEINRFLLQQNDDVVISVDEAANKEFKKFAKINDEGLKETFLETTNEDVKLKEYDGNVKLIRSKLPMKDSVKMGASGLKTKRFRLVMTILLSAIAFGMFGLADTMASYNKVDNTVQSLIDSNVNYASFDKNVTFKDGKYSWTERIYLNDEDYKLLSDKFNIEFLPVYGLYGSASDTKIYIENFHDRTQISSLGCSEIYGCSEGDLKDITSFGTLTGNIPSNNNEIVITKFLAESFVEANYREINSTDKVEINSPNDMLNKNLYLYGRNYKITGILDTNFDLSRYESISDGGIDNLNEMLLMQEYSKSLETSMHGLIFLKKGYYNENLSSNYARVSDRRRIDLIPYTKSDSSINYSVSYIAKNEDITNIIYFDSSKTSIGKKEFVYAFTDLYYVPLNFDETSYIYKYYYERNGGYFQAQDVYFGSIYDVFYDYCEKNELYTLLRQYLYDVIYYYDAVDGQLNPTGNSEWNSERKDYYESVVPYDYQETLKTDLINYINDFKTLFYDKYLTQNKMINELSYGMFKTDFENAYNNHTNFDKNEFLSKILEATFNGGFGYYDIETFDEDVTLMYKLGNYYLEQYKDLVLVDKYEANTRDIIDDYQAVGLCYTLINDHAYYSRAIAVVLSADDDIYKNEIQYTGSYRYVLGKINDTSRSNLKKIVKFNYEEKDIEYHLNNSVMESVNNVNDFIESASKIFLYIGIGFAVFASLLLLNFISISISYKKREIGILRAIGARGMDVFKIFFSEAFIIALINFVFAFIGCFVACYFINRMFRNDYGFLITILHVGIRQLLLMLAVSILVAFISSFLPVYLTARKKPIEAIRSAE